jgi:MFS family permease
VLIAESLPPVAVRVQGSVRRVLHNRRLLLAYASAFFWMFGLGTLLVFLPLSGQLWGFTSMRVGLLFASFALAATLIQASPLGRLSDRWGREPTILFALALVALALLLLSWLNQWGTLMAGMFLYGIGFGFLFPAMSALIADETELQTRGTASGMFTAAFSLGTIAGMGSAGALAWLEQATHLHPFQFVALIFLLGMAWAGAVWFTRTRR